MAPLPANWLHLFGESGSFAWMITVACLPVLLAIAWAWWWRRLDWRPAALLLPAFPLAFVIAARGGPDAGARAILAFSFAFLCRFLLLHAAKSSRTHAAALADRLQSRLPEGCHVFVDLDIEGETPLPSLQAGHIVRVNPGEIIPADGMVTNGSGFVDESLGLGPENSRLKGPGASVYAGSLNKNSTILVRVVAAGEHTMIRRMVANCRRDARPFSLRKWENVDLALTTLGALFFALSGVEQAFHVLLLSNAAAFAALAARSTALLAERGACQGWVWGLHGLERLARAGVLVAPPAGVFTAGRPKVAAIETVPGFSEDIALRFLGPLARKLENPEAFALLLELRSRNIPLEQPEFFEHLPGGGSVLMAGDTYRCFDYPAAREENREFGPLEPFVRTHSAAGSSLWFLEQENRLVAAVAFEDPMLPEAPEAAALLERHGLPVLLAANLPRSATERMRSLFGLNHAHADASEAEIEALLDKLGREGLHPAWVQLSNKVQARATAVLAEGLAGASADVAVFRTDIGSLALVLIFARACALRMRGLIGCLLGTQTGLILLSLSASPRIAQALGLGSGWPLQSVALAAAGFLPGLLAFLLAIPQPRQSEKENV
jgi:cation transport ATPase